MSDEAVNELDQQLWDEQMDRDAAAGKLDFLRDDARAANDGFPKQRP
jgi:hypothetical protein